MASTKKSIVTEITKVKPRQTIEERELHVRLESARQTSLQIKSFTEKHYPFAEYEILGEKKVSYTVEIRSLHDKINTCSCPDYKVNTLGTCKHIEATLHFLKRKGKKQFKELAKTGSHRIEIFLHPKTHEIDIHWPANVEDVHHARTLLNPHLSLLKEPLKGIAAIEHALSGAPQEVADKIRLSQNLIQWKKDQEILQNCNNDRTLFLAEVEAGKRSLQMLSCDLFPYQIQGMLHLAFQGRAILADEMGLGKTIQAIAACELLRRLQKVQKVLVVTPTSLKGEWEEQILRFTTLPTLLVRGSRIERLKFYGRESFFYLVNYEQVRSDYEDIQKILKPDLIILDEAQRIKNWKTKTAWSVKQLKTPYAFVLTGTPIENRIEEIYSIMQMVDSKILGPLYKFHQDFYNTNEEGKPIAYKNLDKLNQRLRTVVLRRRKKDVEDQLPERIVKNYLVEMTSEQAKRYEDYAMQIPMLLAILKQRPLTQEEQKKLQRLLASMRMVAVTPYILDEQCRDCPKLFELKEIFDEYLEEKENKIIIFSEWTRMLSLVVELAEKMGFQYAYHSGSVPQEKRREEIKRFKENPNCRLFLTTDSGSTGLNLQVANVVVNLDIPWNPAKLEQRIARAWRKNQSRVVQTINLVSEDTIEHRMLMMLAMKQAIADVVLDDTGDFTEIEIPSTSRQGFIEKLEQLTSRFTQYRISPKGTSPKNPQDIIKESVLASHGDRIHLLEEHQGKILAVVDKVEPSIKQSLAEIVPGAIEVLDFDSYTILKRLASTGIIQLQNENKKILHQSPLILSLGI